MPDDLFDNESIFDLNELFTSAPKRILEVGFSYMSGDLTGLFTEGRLQLAPLSAFTNFNPRVNQDKTLDWTDEARTGLTRDQWDALKGVHNDDLQPSTLRDDVLCETFQSELFPAFQSKSPNNDSDEESTGSSNNLIERSAQDTSDVEDEQYSRYGDESSGGYNLVKSYDEDINGEEGSSGSLESFINDSLQLKRMRMIYQPPAQ
ncbi:hypothetical protein N7452_001884 [Penicillium brevicompactum]|uniref:Uncharacterized protein n=1 Tax=Penicillium brevicompactum TaxID=5074 RepID=A0A9W9R3F5_PENBR|nr:hypothetical protein N7452_001884 [Penicillium brevicompactum]